MLVKYQTGKRKLFYMKSDKKPLLEITAGYLIFNWEIFTGIDSFSLEKPEPWMNKAIFLSWLLTLVVYLAFFTFIIGIIISVSLAIDLSIGGIIIGIISFIIFAFPMWLLSKLSKFFVKYFMVTLPEKNGWGIIVNQ